MIIVEAVYEIKEGCRQELYDRLMVEHVAENSRNDEGNLKYDYYFDPENENRMILLEHWTSLELLRKHSQSEHLAKMRSWRGAYVTGQQVRKFECTEI